MTQNINVKISENQVEEALISNTTFLSKLLDTENNLTLLARQLRLNNGKQRIDLLLISKKELYLIELKICQYTNKFLEQVISYRIELNKLQGKGELVSGQINTYLFVTKASKYQIDSAKLQNVLVIIYSPLNVLNEYYTNIRSLSPYLNIKPNDYGVFSLGLINRTIKALGNGHTTKTKISDNTNLSKNSVTNHLVIAEQFGLVKQRNKNYLLTDLGEEYFLNLDSDGLINKLTEKQIFLLKKFIAKAPFYSPSVFGVYSIVESSFLLARNIYPISLDELRKVFRIISGKMLDWQAERTMNTVTYTFLNYAIDLDLLGKIGQQIVITPSGFNFILMLELHKSIEMVESLSSKQ